MAAESFPPELKAGARVWTEAGFADHGPLEGPRQDIAGPQGGRIESESTPYGSFSSLYSVVWDNGQRSKHYSGDLMPIGDSTNLQEFFERFEFVGAVTMRVGPRGGFKEPAYKVIYDGREIADNTRDRRLWTRLLEPAVDRQGIRIVETPFE